MTPKYGYWDFQFCSTKMKSCLHPYCDSCGTNLDFQALRLAFTKCSNLHDPD